MDKRLDELIKRIKKLENELSDEIQKKQDEFYYTIQQKKVYFEKDIRASHRYLAQTISRYLLESDFLTILTAPVIWFCLLPALFLDLTVSVYQAVCFPVYGIPRVKRSKYIILDRHALSYLNLIEKINCVYCGYFNGLMAYVREIAARTEQYWCPIKHARRVAFIHSRYAKFMEFGDARGYRDHLEKIRRDFADLS